MNLRRSPLFAAATLLTATAFGAQGQTSSPPHQQTLYYIPHTHWEGAVFKTREEYLEMGLPNILKALALLKQYLDFKFTLDGASYIAMTDREPVPTAGAALLSRDFAGKPGTIVRGPVFSELRVSHPFGNRSFTTRVRLYNDLRRVDITTELVNNEKFVRYQVLFPTTIK
jgi:hypothetical protein